MKQWKQALFSAKVGKAERIVLLLYPLLLLLLTRFHEFHFDEIQAWQIAKSASIYDIVCNVEHYEGHPPLWHLLLAVFAKAGLPFQIVLPAINILFSTAAMAILLFRSPFPKVIRCALPFSYYFFYQYGVISRPYSILMLAIMLAAANYHKRNAHPWRYILSLCLLCLSSAFGIMIAGVFCLIWTFEILKEIHHGGSLTGFLRSARFFSLLLILLLAVSLFLMIYPAEDCYYAGKLTDQPFAVRISSIRYWELWAALPFDIWLGQMMGTDSAFISETGLVIEGIAGLAILIISGMILHHNKILTVGLLPYLCLSGFIIFGYSSAHHLGILALLHVFTAWILLEKHPELPAWIQKIRTLAPNMKKCLSVFGALAASVPLVYTLMASIYDVRLPYYAVQFDTIIRENHLEDKRILTSWNVVYEDKNGGLFIDLAFPWPTHYMPAPHPEIRYQLTDIDGLSTVLCAYAGKNYFMNYNADCPDDLYMHYRWKEDASSELDSLRQQGLPDLIIGYVPIDSVYGEEMLQDVSYVAIADVKSYDIYKATCKENTVYLFIREDLLPEYPQFTRLFP